jgi:hypothetical protein
MREKVLQHCKQRALWSVLIVQRESSDLYVLLLLVGGCVKLCRPYKGCLVQFSEFVRHLAAQYPGAHVSELIAMAQDMPHRFAMGHQIAAPAEAMYGAAPAQPPQVGAHMWSLLSPAQQKQLQNLSEPQRQQVSLFLNRRQSACIVGML